MDTNSPSSKPAPVTNPSHSTTGKNVPMAILAYIGPLVIISYILAKDDQFVKFHIKQGLILLVGEVVIWLLGMVFWPLWILLDLVNIIILVLAIVGIVNAAKGEEKELPWVGKYAKEFKI